MLKVGIAGYGAMGQLIHRLIDENQIDAEVLAYDPKLAAGNYDDISQLKDCDLIFLALTTHNLTALLEDLGKINLAKDKLLISIAACMSFSKETLIKYNYNNFLLAHPLFGPASYSTIKEYRFAVDKTNSEANLNKYAEKLSDFSFIPTTASEHDQLMADQHFLPYFLSHLAKDLDLKSNHLEVSSCKHLYKYIESTTYSPQVLKEILEFNPYAKTALKKLKSKLNDLEAKICE